MAATSSFPLVTSRSSTRVTTSPARRPACSAGPPGVTWPIDAPFAVRSPAAQRDAEDGARCPTRPFEFLRHPLGLVDRNRETHPDGAALRTGRRDRGIDSDQRALHVDERTAGIARIDRGVGLHRAQHGRLARAGLLPDADRPVERADDPRRDRAAEAQRRAERHHLLADAHRVGVAEGRPASARRRPAPAARRGPSWGRARRSRRARWCRPGTARRPGRRWRPPR